MKKKIRIIILLTLLIIVSAIGICYLEQYNFGIIEAIVGAFMAYLFDNLFKAIQNLWDTSNWMVTQRNLERGKMINKNTVIRISFSYLYRIKIGNKYLLVKNARNTKKFQPVGGVYKMLDDEKNIEKNKYHIMDDDKIVIDKSSRDDYRIRIENRYLRKFIRRFDKNAKRERIDNVGREFREELIDIGILNWKNISYRYCGRQMTNLKFSEHFQTYELLLYDIVELLPTNEQEEDLKGLLNKKSKNYCFATAEQIESLGINTENEILNESIGDHTINILQEKESGLMKMPGVGKTYSVEL